MVLKLGGQGQVGPVVFGGDDETGGVPVNAVDDTRADGPVDARQGAAAVIEQGVDQGAVRVAGGGVDHQAHRLVHHDHVVVLKHHVQGDVLGLHVDGLRVGQGEGHLVPGGGLIVLLHRRAVDGDGPLLQQALGGGAGQPLHAAGQKGVQPLAGLLDGEGEGGHERCSWGCRPFSSRS